jgi:hypothetical protein
LLPRFAIKFESEKSELPLAGPSLVQTAVGSSSQIRVHLHENLNKRLNEIRSMENR